MGALIRRITFAIVATLLLVASIEVRHEHKIDGPCFHCISMASRRRFLAALATPRELYPASTEAWTTCVFAPDAEQAVLVTWLLGRRAQPVLPRLQCIATNIGCWRDWPTGAPRGRAPPPA